MLEKTIVRNIQKYIKTLPNAWCVKTHGGPHQAAGLPDLVVIYLGCTVWFEVKNEKGKVTALQAATHQRMADAGGDVYVVRSVDEVRGVLDRTTQLQRALVEMQGEAGLA